MLKKIYSRSGSICRATFKLNNAEHATTAYLVGDFNNWDITAHPMRRLHDGSFNVTLSLDANETYRFRYWLGGDRWENDPEADDYVSNGMGSDDSVIRV